MSQVDVLRQPDKLPEQFVSWLRRFISDNSLVSARGTSSSTKQVPIFLDSPDSSSNAFVAFFSDYGITQANIGRHVAPAFPKSVDGTWEGLVRVPQDYAGSGVIVLSWFCNATTGALRHRVSSKNVADGATYNVTYTDESYVNTTVPGTALFRFDTSFVLTPTLAAGDDLYVKVTRNGSSGSDTLSATAVLARTHLQYTSG